ncbi:hypothetical protein ACFFJT_11135 [Dyella flava]|uniref:Uncharacterized protein n=1 Tax=Dyella flava TaxID=1920170 RepID=A0ABS2JYC2_9GAMM|nr:hypothetical protein [Dyella flava]MBM7123993.1 hypothetical protein [Dyella flava]GLQ50561.1 hypothetical protein GCM10010872_20100 [Dyella flava]
MTSLQDTKIAVVGFRYMALPLVVAFGKRYDMIGLGVNVARIEALCAESDDTQEVSNSELRAASHLRYASMPDEIRERRVDMVTIQAPIDAAKRADLSPLVRSNETLGKAPTAGYQMKVSVEESMASFVRWHRDYYGV